MKKSERFLLNMRRTLYHLLETGVIDYATFTVSLSSLSYTIVPLKYTGGEAQHLGI